ncbi:MAG TPA: nuclear transport factor 2 family protein [Gemmatimonadales bacterium]|nr:nuclear transport factor 2 family protein [Gemmatimonadales bacterium]
MTRASPFLLAAAVACTPAAGADQSADIQRLTAQLDSAWNARDTATVAQLMSPAYAYFSSRGDVVPREAFLQFLSEPTYRLDFVERSDVEPRFDGSTALVSTRWRGRGSWKGEAFVDDQRCSMVWHRAFDGWRLMSEHCTQIVPRDSSAT